MSETSGLVEYDVCPTCGALVGDKAKHARWHQGEGGRAETSVSSAIDRAMIGHTF